VVGRPGQAPGGWRELLVARLVAQGRHLGVIVLGNLDRPEGQIKEEKSTLEQILGLSSDGILLLDGKGRVRVWNQAMERITGVPADEAVGLPYNEWLAGLDHDGKPVRLEDLLAAATPAGPGPPRRCRSAPPRAWSAGCAATTRCCTRAGSGPPTW
jgi:PAS domain-containing protein